MTKCNRCQRNDIPLFSLDGRLICSPCLQVVEASWTDLEETQGSPGHRGLFQIQPTFQGP